MAAGVPAATQQYSAKQTGDVVQLADATHHTSVSILPSFGNQAFEMKVKGHNVLRYPHASIEEFKAKPGSVGIPLLAPWANRLDEQAFYANGKRYPFDMELGNVRGAIPIHGFLQTTNQWQVVETKSDGTISVGDEPPGVLSSAGVDEAVAVRAHHRDDLSAAGRRARSADENLEPQRRADAGRDRLSPVLSVDRRAARRVDALRSARARAGCWRRTRCRPARPSRSRS